MPRFSLPVRTHIVLWADYNSNVARAKEEEVEEGGFCCDPVYYFGWGFLLAVWSWGDWCSQQALRTLVGHSLTQKPHGHGERQSRRQR